MPKKKFIRSTTAPVEELVVACEQDDCVRRFRTLMGMRTHLWRVHGISHKGNKLPKGATQCSECEKKFDLPVQLTAHGGPEACRKRLANNGWRTFTCQNTSCGKEYEKYAGPKGNRKGTKYCSTTCAGLTRRVSYYTSCKTCYVDMKVTNKNQKYCSHKCSRGWKIKDTTNMGGPRAGGGHSKLLPYTSSLGEEMKLNREEIQMAEYLDSTGLTWTRNWKGFPYVNKEGKPRKFYPDFYVESLDLYVEYKGWVNEAMEHKMLQANNLNPDLKLAIVVGPNKRYLHHGTPLTKLVDGNVSITDVSVVKVKE